MPWAARPLWVTRGVQDGCLNRTSCLVAPWLQLDPPEAHWVWPPPSQHTAALHERCHLGCTGRRGAGRLPEQAQHASSHVWLWKGPRPQGTARHCGRFCRGLLIHWRQGQRTGELAPGGLHLCPSRLSRSAEPKPWPLPMRISGCALLVPHERPACSPVVGCCACCSCAGCVRAVPWGPSECDGPGGEGLVCRQRAGQGDARGTAALGQLQADPEAAGDEGSSVARGPLFSRGATSDA